jgi:NAD(P) transhydrogenase subunit alpha
MLYTWRAFTTTLHHAGKTKSDKEKRMRIAVLRETQTGEARVALAPESVKKLVALKAEVAVEAGAGRDAGASDDDYAGAGAAVSKSRAALLSTADVLAFVNRPAESDTAQM